MAWLYNRSGKRFHQLAANELPDIVMRDTQFYQEHDVIVEKNELETKVTIGPVVWTWVKDTNPGTAYREHTTRKVGSPIAINISETNFLDALEKSGIRKE